MLKYKKKILKKDPKSRIKIWVTTYIYMSGGDKNKLSLYQNIDI